MLSNSLHGNARNRGRVQIAADLPLVSPLGRSKDLPGIRYPPPGNARPTAARERTGKLESKLFLETLPVYRYLATPPRRHG